MTRPELSERQVQILTGISHGLTNTAIGTHLHISGHTAKWHVSALLRQLDAVDRANAVRLGFEHGWLRLRPRWTVCDLCQHPAVWFVEQASACDQHLGQVMRGVRGNGFTPVIPTRLAAAHHPRRVAS